MIQIVTEKNQCVNMCLTSLKKLLVRGRSDSKISTEQINTLTPLDNFTIS